MRKTNSNRLDFELWRLIGRVNHSILLLRQRELRQHRIPVRQLHILGVIKDLGQNATLNEVAMVVEREPNVISKQTVSMEKDGLIKRSKSTSKSNLLKLELTQKGLGLIEVSRQSESISAIFSCLSEQDREQIRSLLNNILIQAQKFKSSKYDGPARFAGR